jgi:hypothetical protein
MKKLSEISAGSYLAKSRSCSLTGGKPDWGFTSIVRLNVVIMENPRRKGIQLGAVEVEHNGGSGLFDWPVTQ